MPQHLGPAASIWRISENDEILKRLWADGMSASLIAAQITGASRNAVIGRVHRLGLSGRQTPLNITLARKTPATRAPRPSKPRRIADYAKDTSLATRAIARKKRAEEPVAEVLDLPPDQSAHALTFLARPLDTCCWPLNDITPIELHMVCASPRDDSRSYCDRHHHLSRQKPSGMTRGDLEIERRKRHAAKTQERLLQGI